jgi:hypothetical protein
MQVDLRDLKPNPTRDFKIDPLDESRIAMLAESIKDDGFWGGIVCRMTLSGEIQIAAGHHRTEGAILAGETMANLFVREDADDAWMIRVYARENATQRGNHATAQTGSVASTVRFLTKKILTGDICGIPQMSQRAIESARGNIASDKGIGRDIILEFLEGIPGITRTTIEQALANMKASGNYARIIGEVQGEIERENAEAVTAMKQAEREKQKAEERARKAEVERKEATAKADRERKEADQRKREAERARKEAEKTRLEEQAKKQAEEEKQRAEKQAKEAEARQRKAEEQRKKAEEKAAEAKAKREEAEAKSKEFAAVKKAQESAAKAAAAAAADKKSGTFDFEGVTKHINVPHQIDIFRERVMLPEIAKILPFENQAALAEHLVNLANKINKGELTGVFIKEHITAEIVNIKAVQKRITKEEEEVIRRKDFQARFEHFQHEFCRSCRGMIKNGIKISELFESWPEDLLPPDPSPEFLDIVARAKEAIDGLYERI